MMGMAVTAGYDSHVDLFPSRSVGVYPKDLPNAIIGGLLPS
jgi:hypothetical protein